MTQIKQQIIQTMNTTMLGTVSLAAGTKLFSALVIYGHDAAGNIYICARKDSHLVQAAGQSSVATFTVYREESDLQQMAGLTVTGTPGVLPDPHGRESLEAYHFLDRKSPLLGNIPVEQRLDEFRIIKIQPDMFRYQSYTDYLNGAPPAVLRKRPAPPQK